MKVSIYKTTDRFTVCVNQSGKGFDSEEAALEYLDSIVRETQSAVDSARETYFSMK